MSDIPSTSRADHQLASIQCHLCDKSFTQRGINIHIARSHGSSQDLLSDVPTATDEHNLPNLHTTNDGNFSVSTQHIPCQFCPSDDIKHFRSLRGLRIHCSRSHPNAPLMSNSKSANFSQMDFHSQLLECKRNIHVLRRIPKGARSFAADCLSHVICNMKIDL